MNIMLSLPYSLPSCSYRPFLVSSTSGNFLPSSLSSSSPAGFRPASSLQLSDERIRVWNPVFRSRARRIDVRLPVPHPRCGPSSSGSGVEGERSLRQWIELLGEALSTAFPVWVALGCLLGLLRPAAFNWVRPRWTVLGITLTMLGMGMTLTLDDLRGALAMPKELISGFLLQYSVSSFICLFHCCRLDCCSNEFVAYGFC